MENANNIPNQKDHLEEIVPGIDISTFYATSVGVALNEYNCTLQLREELPDLINETQSQNIKFQTTNALLVHMSPQTAKSLAALLAYFIKDYESRLEVSLAIPKDIQKIWNDNIKS